MKPPQSTHSDIPAEYEVVIIGGSYAGLAAAMALGRSLRKTLVVDSGKPCNRQTPYSHNFLTRDGVPPADIARIAKEQVQQYASVNFSQSTATSAKKLNNSFMVWTDQKEKFFANKIIFASGIEDLIPDIQGLAECWGISVLHCPYCHGYEVRAKNTAILGNGDAGFEFTRLLSNWTHELTLYTNGKSTLKSEQSAKLRSHNIRIVEEEIDHLHHENGHLQHLGFKNGNTMPADALYIRPPFKQHCNIPQELGCQLTDGLIEVNSEYQTSVKGAYACGDNISRMRTVAHAVSSGTSAGMNLNRHLIEENF